MRGTWTAISRNAGYVKFQGYNPDKTVTNPGVPNRSMAVKAGRKYHWQTIVLSTNSVSVLPMNRPTGYTFLSAVRPLDTLSIPNSQPWSFCACQI